MSSIGRTSTEGTGQQPGGLHGELLGGQVDHVEATDLLDRLGVRPLGGAAAAHGQRALRPVEGLTEQHLAALADRRGERRQPVEERLLLLLRRGLPLVEVVLLGHQDQEPHEAEPPAAARISMALSPRARILQTSTRSSRLSDWTM